MNKKILPQLMIVISLFFSSAPIFAHYTARPILEWNGQKWTQEQNLAFWVEAINQIKGVLPLGSSIQGEIQLFK